MQTEELKHEDIRKRQLIGEMNMKKNDEGRYI